MALEACRECGARVSTEAVSCPQCGVPQPTRRAERQPAAGPVEGSFASRDTMTSNEDPIYRARMHWSIYSHALIAGILAITVIVLNLSDILAIALGVITLVLTAIAYIRGTSTEFVITTRRLIAKRGIVSRRTIETLLEKVEAVSVEQGLLGRMLNYGTVTVQGTGGTRESFVMVSDPMQLRKVIHEQIDTLRPVAMVTR
jgi:uncharacterized membrane protein YdbT with pleckstrin-like domain